MKTRNMDASLKLWTLSAEVHGLTIAASAIADMGPQPGLHSVLTCLREKAAELVTLADGVAVGDAA